MTRLPPIVSVDDHVVEPPDLWVNRVPERYRHRRPRVRRERGVFAGRLEMRWSPDRRGDWADVWYYEDLVKPMTRIAAAAGTDTKVVDWEVVTFDDIRPGCWRQRERLDDMDLNGTEASVCFPNLFTRFCGQTFAEQEDKELALLCVRAYNDWIIDEWCAGEGHGRLIPLIIVPLWDVRLAVGEVRRCAAKGAAGVSFSESPQGLGLPSFYTREWDPFFAACEETDVTVAMHIGSSSRLATTCPEAPHVVTSALTFQYGMHSLVDVVYAGILERFRNLRILYAEANVGWMPYVLERMDKAFLERGADTEYGWSGLSQPPSAYLRDRVFGCVVDDETGLALRDRIGMRQICFETDYPHADSKFPRSAEVAASLCAGAGLDDDEARMFVRENAIRAFRLERFGLQPAGGCAL